MPDESQGSPTFGGFDLIAELAATRYGKTYQALQRNPARYVRLLLIEAALTADAEYLSRFLLQAKTGMSVRHPNLAEVYDASMADGFYYLSSEWVDGVTAADWIG